MTTEHFVDRYSYSDPIPNKALAVQVLLGWDRVGVPIAPGLMSVYVADAEWDGEAWVATVRGLPGAVTQGPDLASLPERVAEVVRLMADPPTDANGGLFVIVTSPGAGGDPAPEATKGI